MHSSSPVLCNHLQLFKASEHGLHHLADPAVTLGWELESGQRREDEPDLYDEFPALLPEIVPDCPCGPSGARWPSAGGTPGVGG